MIKCNMQIAHVSSNYYIIIHQIVRFVAKLSGIANCCYLA